MIGLKSNVMITRYYKIAKIIIDKKEVLSTEDRWFLVPGDFFYIWMHTSQSIIKTICVYNVVGWSPVCDCGIS